MVPNWVDALDGVRENHPSLLLWWDSSEVLGPVLHFPVQARHKFIWVGRAKGLKDGWETQVSCYTRSHLGYLGYFSLKDNRLRRVLFMCISTQQKEQRRWSQTLPSDARCQGERQQPQVKYRKSDFNMRKHFFLVWRWSNIRPGCPETL